MPVEPLPHFFLVNDQVSVLQYNECLLIPRVVNSYLKLSFFFFLFPSFLKGLCMYFVYKIVINFPVSLPLQT